MKESEKPQVDALLLEEFLGAEHGTAIIELLPLEGGFWSSAYSYSADGQDYVLRLGHSAEGYRIDAAAVQFSSSALPIPVIIKNGKTQELHFSISRRHYGHFIEAIPEQEASRFSEAMSKLLMALRSASSTGRQQVIWHQKDATILTWQDWLLSGLVDDPTSHVGGWRAHVAADEPLNQLFEQCEREIHALLPYCPERRDLIHGDLLHQNVLVSRDANEVSAVFSWKCSVLGDFLFDVAWCTLWAEWHPVIEKSDLWNRTLLADDLDSVDLENAAIRNRCYELQIAASHIGWFTWTGDEQNLLKMRKVIEKKLAHGPLSSMAI